MKVWTKVKIEQKNKEIDALIHAYTNYLFKDNMMSVLALKYHIGEEDIEKMYETIAARIAGILILYIGNDKKRLYDIFKRYQGKNTYLKQVTPIVEGYIER